MPTEQPAIGVWKNLPSHSASRRGKLQELDANGPITDVDLVEGQKERKKHGCAVSKIPFHLVSNPKSDPMVGKCPRTDSNKCWSLNTLPWKIANLVWFTYCSDFMWFSSSQTLKWPFRRSISVDDFVPLGGGPPRPRLGGTMAGRGSSVTCTGCDVMMGKPDPIRSNKW